MKYFSPLLILLLAIILTGCTEEQGKNESSENYSSKRDTVKQILLSQETSIRAAENLTAEIKIPTAVCNMCENNITKAVKKLDGIIKVSADSDKKIAIVTFDGAKTTTEMIRQAISKAGYDADNIKRDNTAYAELDDCCKTETSQ